MLMSSVILRHISILSNVNCELEEGFKVDQYGSRNGQHVVLLGTMSHEIRSIRQVW